MLNMDNKWFIDVWQNYNLWVTVVIPTVAGIVLKIIAIVHPGVTTNKIIDLIENSLPVKKIVP